MQCRRQCHSLRPSHGAQSKPRHQHPLRKKHHPDMTILSSGKFRCQVDVGFSHTPATSATGPGPPLSEAASSTRSSYWIRWPSFRTQTLVYQALCLVLDMGFCIPLTGLAPALRMGQIGGQDSVASFSFRTHVHAASWLSSLLSSCSVGSHCCLDVKWSCRPADLTDRHSLTDRRIHSIVAGE